MPNEGIKIFHDGKEDYYDSEEGDFGQRHLVKVTCLEEDDARDVGAVVSLLKRHDADEIREAVEGPDGRS